VLTDQHAITNYYVDINSSGFVEGLNNKIKVLKRRCYGITNVKHLFQRLHLDISGYAIFGVKTMG
jgi:transposase